jgi:hypothetical protein
MAFDLYIVRERPPLLIIPRHPSGKFRSSRGAAGQEVPFPDKFDSRRDSAGGQASQGFKTAPQEEYRGRGDEKAQQGVE